MRLFSSLALLALFALVALPSCGSDGRGVDTCRKIEAARCERGPACVANFSGDPTSCTRYYDVQCGRGLQDAVREPTAAELAACLEAIKGTCSAALDPAKAPACSFLVAATPTDTGTATDTGSADTGGDSGSEASADATDAD